MAAARRVAAVPRRRASPVDEARAAYDRGELTRALQILDAEPIQRRDTSAETLLLRARTLLTLNRPQAAVTALKSLDAPKGSADEISATALRGAALTRIGRRTQGEKLLGDAYAAARRRAPRIVPEIAYYRALSRWNAFATDEADAIIEEGLALASGTVRARLLQLLGWVDVRREDYAAAARSFVRALETLDAAPSDDAPLRARTLHALAIIAAETIDLRLGRIVRNSAERMSWTDDVRVERAAVISYLAWISLLEGNRDGAWDAAQHALSLTIDSSSHASALVAAAGISSIVGDHFAARRYLSVAGALLLRGDQTDLDIEQRVAMLEFASSATSANAAIARDVLTLYDRTRPSSNDLLAFHGDRRIDALEAFARGRVHVAEGLTRAGGIDMNRALDLWTRLGYRLRAALAANALFRLTGEQRYATAALDTLRTAPAAWLHELLAHRAADNDPLTKLTAAERRVLTELCKGKRAREIAQTFGRSFNTINNQTRRVFSAFEVRSRAALVAKCARLGILDELQTTVAD